MFDRPQPGCFSWHTIQVNSCIIQNVFPIPQYVKISFISFKHKSSSGHSPSPFMLAFTKGREEMTLKQWLHFFSTEKKELYIFRTSLGKQIKGHLSACLLDTGSRVKHTFRRKNTHSFPFTQLPWASTSANQIFTCVAFSLSRWWQFLVVRNSLLLKIGVHQSFSSVLLVYL